MKNIHYIDIVFENCESIIVPVEQIQKMKTKNEKLIKDDKGFYRENTYRCDYFSLSIFYREKSELIYDSEAYEEPLGMFVGNPMSNHVKDRPNILGRIINHKDVVCIELLDEEENQLKTIYVPWHHADQYDNRWMNISSKNGVLEIEIKEN